MEILKNVLVVVIRSAPKYFLFSIVCLAVAGGLKGQYSIANTEMTLASIPQLSSGEADPRMDLLRLGFDIEVVARMSRDEAFLVLRAFYSNESEPITLNQLKELVELVDTGAEVDDLMELIDAGVGVDDLLELIDAGVAVDLLSEAAQLANLILTDATVSSNPLDEDRIFTRNRLMVNSFNTEVVKLVAAHSSNDLIAENIVNVLNTGKLNSTNQYIGKLAESINESNNSPLLNARPFRDRKTREKVGDLFGLTTDDFVAFAGKNVVIKAGSTVDVSKWMGRNAQAPDKARVLAFAAGGDLRIQGDVTFTNSGYEAMDHALAVGAAEDLEITEGSTVKYDGSNFGLGATKSIRIVKVSLETSDHLAMGTLDHLHVEDSTMKAGAGNRVLLYAQNTMQVNGLAFSAGLGQVYMEATTLDLQNVDFPAGSEVRLISELGAIDGKYPNFHSSVPGRVNFIEAVSYGGTANLMNDRASFDQHGGRISIQSFGK